MLFILWMDLPINLTKMLRALCWGAEIHAKSLPDFFHGTGSSKDWAAAAAHGGHMELLKTVMQLGAVSIVSFLVALLMAWWILKGLFRVLSSELASKSLPPSLPPAISARLPFRLER